MLLLLGALIASVASADNAFVAGGHGHSPHRPGGSWHARFSAVRAALAPAELNLEASGGGGRAVLLEARAASDGVARPAVSVACVGAAREGDLVVLVASPSGATAVRSCAGAGAGEVVPLDTLVVAAGEDAAAAAPYPDEDGGAAAAAPRPASPSPALGPAAAPVSLLGSMLALVRTRLANGAGLDLEPAPEAGGVGGGAAAAAAAPPLAAGAPALVAVLPPSAAAAPVHSVHAMLFALERAAGGGVPAAYGLVASARLGLGGSSSSAEGDEAGAGAGAPWRGRLGRDGHGQRHAVRGEPPQAPQAPQARLLSGDTKAAAAPPAADPNANATATGPVTCGLVGLPDCPQNSTSDAIFAMIEGKVAVLISFIVSFRHLRERACTKPRNR